MRKLRLSYAALRRQAWLARNRSRFSTPRVGGKPHLLVDLSVIARHDARTGIQRVVRAIWSELSRRSDERFDVVPVYAGAGHGYCYARVNPVSESVVLTGKTVHCGPGDKFLGLDLAAHYLPHYVDQFRAWRASGASVHNVVYDVLPLERPEWFTPATRRHFPLWFEAVKECSDQLLCISDSVGAEVRSKLAQSTASVRRIFLSGNIEGSMPSNGISTEVASLLRAMSARPTILMVGTVEPRKGYDAALAAFNMLWTSEHTKAPDLLIVGKAGWCTGDLQGRLEAHPEKGRRLHWHKSVSDEALTEMYDRCAGVLVASLAEGFGLPLAEAAFHRKWVLCRDLPVFREQALPNCAYFDDDDPASLGAQIVALSESAEREEPPEAALLDWSDCLERLMDTLGFADPVPNRAAEKKSIRAEQPSRYLQEGTRERSQRQS